jgi:hypothetical protein
MRNLKHVFAAAILGCVIVLPQTGSAGPLAASLGAASSTIPVIADGPIQKVHGWHCSRRYGWYKGRKWRHRHIRACDDYDDEYDEDYRTYRPTPNVYIRPVPQIGVYIGGHGGGHGDWD